MTWAQTGTLTAAAILAATAGEAQQELDCVIEPKAVVEIVADGDGRIDEIAARRGERIERGDLVARLDDQLQRLQLEMSRIRAETDIELHSQETRLRFRRKELDRVDRLAERNVASESVRDDAEIEVVLTELAVQEAQLAQKLAQVELKQAEAELERRRIVSPVSGIIMSVEAEPGEFATEQTVIASLAEIDPLYVEVFVPADFYDAFSKGDRMVVSLMPPLEGSHEAIVSVIDPVFDAASGTFGMRLELPNESGAIPAGVRCRLHVAEG